MNTFEYNIKGDFFKKNENGDGEKILKVDPNHTKLGKII